MLTFEKIPKNVIKRRMPACEATTTKGEPCSRVPTFWVSDSHKGTRFAYCAQHTYIVEANLPRHPV